MSAAARAAVEATLALAREAALHQTATENARRARSTVDRTVELSAALARATADAREPLVRLRAALQDVFAEHSPAAEAAFRRMNVREGTEQAARLLRDTPRALLPEPQPAVLPGGWQARSAAAATGLACGPLIARLDRTIMKAGLHVGRQDLPLDPLAAARLLQEALSVQQQLAAGAEAQAREAERGGMLTQVRHAWAGLSPEQQDAVRLAFPEVETLLRPNTHSRSAGAER